MSNVTNKKFLDEVGLASLWEKINTGFSPRWSAYKPAATVATHEATVVKLPFSSAGVLTVDGTKYGEPIVMDINPATKTTAGVMSAADKTKLDNMSGSISSAITLTDVAIEGTKLSKGTEKCVNIGFDYDSATNMLRLLDNNAENGPTAVATVDVDDIIGDTFKSSFLRDAAVVDRKDGETEATGMYIRLVFIINNNDGTEGTRELGPFYIDIDDLVDTYTAGTGIKIDTAANTGVDGIKSSHKINLKTATTSVIGGVKIYKDNSTYTLTAKTSPIGANTDAVTDDLRYYGVEIDKNDKAFVYMPPETVVVNEPTAPAQQSIAHAGTFNAFTDLDVEVNQDSGDIILKPTLQTYKLPSETNISIGTPATACTPAGGLSHGGSLTVVTGFSVSGTAKHTITPVTSTYTLPSKTTITADAKPTTGITKAELIADNPDSVCAVVTNITMDGNKIKPTYSNLWVNVYSIENSVIEGLSYVTA